MSASNLLSATSDRVKQRKGAKIGSIWGLLYTRLRQLLTRGEKLRLAAILLGMLTAAVADAACIGALSYYTSLIADPTKVSEGFLRRWVGNWSNEQTALYGGLVVIALFIVRFVLTFWLVWQRTGFVERLRVRLSTGIFTRYMHAPWEFHLQHNSAELLRNVVTETNQLSMQVLLPALNYIASSAQLLAVIAVLLLTADMIGLMPLLPVGIVVGIFLMVTRHRLVQYGKQVQRERKESIRQVREGLASLPETRILGKTDFISARYEDLVERFTRVQRKFQLINNITTPLLETAVVGALVAVIVTLFVMGRTIAEVGPLVVLMAAASMRLKTALTAIATANGQIRFSQASLELVCDELQRPSGPSSFDLGSTFSSYKSWNELRFTDVGFCYKGSSTPALYAVNLKIQRGDRIGIEGGSGSGKTTLVGLILGILDPTNGTVTLDGRKLRDVTRYWHPHIGYVPQDVFITDDTLERNIAFGVPRDKVDRSQLERAIEMAQLDQTLRAFPLGLDTVAGENGSRLSGGQRQRIGLARALYRNPNILILDEATSALDSATEQQFIETIRQLPSSVTIVSIAHRPQALEFASQYLQVENGRVRAYPKTGI